MAQKPPIFGNSPNSIAPQTNLSNVYVNSLALTRTSGRWGFTPQTPHFDPRNRPHHGRKHPDGGLWGVGTFHNPPAIDHPPNSAKLNGLQLGRTFPAEGTVFQPTRPLGPHGKLSWRGVPTSVGGGNLWGRPPATKPGPLAETSVYL